MDIEETAGEVVDSAFKLHTRLGPGLLESVYQRLMVQELRRRGLFVEPQVFVRFEFDGLTIDDGLKIDLLVNRHLVVELKAVEVISPVHPKQVLTYLRLTNLPLGLLINFGGATLKEGLRRIVNNHFSVSSRLRVQNSL